MQGDSEDSLTGRLSVSKPNSDLGRSGIQVGDASRKVSPPSGFMPPDLSGDAIPAPAPPNVLSSFQFIAVSIALTEGLRDHP